MTQSWETREYDNPTRPLTAKDEVSICTHCNTIATGAGPCLKCTSPTFYARFYGKDELAWWVVQYMRHEDRQGAHYVRDALNVLKRATKGSKKSVKAT